MGLLGRSKASPVPEALINRLIDQKFELFRREQESKTEFALAELRSQLITEQQVHDLYTQSSQELINRVGQLEASVEKLHHLVTDGFFVPNLSSRPKATNVTTFSPRGSPLYVQTVMEDGNTFQTVEPPEMATTPRNGASQSPRQDTPGTPRSLEKIPLDMRGSSSQPCPRMDEPFLSGPRWGIEDEEDMEPVLGGLVSARSRRRVAPWNREPDEGSVSQKTAVWLWQIDLARAPTEEGSKMGLELYHDPDTDELIVTRVKNGLVATWNAVNASRCVEVGDVIVGVGSCTENGEVMQKHLGSADSLKIKRDMANWHRIRATKMGYVEPVGGRHRPGPTY